MNTIRMISLLAVALLFSSCRLEVPDFDSGTVFIHSPIAKDADIRNIPKAPQYELVETQAKELANWLDSHREDWKFKIEDTAPGIMIHLRSDEENVAVLNVHEEFIKVGDRFRRIDREERLTLKEIIKKDG